MNAVEMSVASSAYPPSVASSRRHGTHHSGRSRSAAASSRTMSRNVRRLQEAVNLHLNNYEKELFLDALNEYHSLKDSWGFVELLRTILNTPAKQQLVSMIRLVLPPSDIPEFDKCVQLSAAVARGDQGASRITGAASSSAVRRIAHNTRSHGTSYHSAPVRLKPKSHSSDRQSAAPTTDLHIIQIQPDTDGLGFSIKSGTRDKLGVFVSAVDPASDAFSQGLSVGDEILEANDIDLSRTTNQDAAVILQAARSLMLTVRSTKNSERPETYTWVDTEGRSCSPPPSEKDMHNTLRSSVSRRSGMSIMSNQDERKINLQIEKGHGLGLTIRGGSEYGLGVYITGVDHSSAAKRAGIRVGDQVLAVNDVQLVEITHREAVKVLKKSRHMMLTLKHVGKLPHAKIERIQTSGRSHSSTGRRSRSQSRRHHSVSSEDLHRSSKGRYPGSLDRKTHRREQESKPVFTKGAGSQLMLSHSSMSSHHHALVDEQARNLLNDNERGTLKFYVDEYNKAYVSVDALVGALKELFNTHAKFQMFHELRSLIHPRDMDRYDRLVVKYEVISLKSRLDQSQDQMSDFSLDSILSMHSSSSPNESLSLNSPTNQNPVSKTSHSNASTLMQSGKGSVRSNKMFITDGSNQSVVTDPQSMGSVRRRSQVVTAEISHCSSAEDSPRDNSKNVPRMGMRAAKISTKPDGRSPSDDSGVDVRAKAGSTSQSGSSYNDTITRPTNSSPPLCTRPPATPPFYAEPPATHSDSESSSVAAVKQHYRQSYSLSGSDDADSEDDRIPGLHSDLESTSHSNVVLVNSKDVGTLPRQQRKMSETPSSLTSNSSPSATFRQQVKNRAALTGKMYLPPSTSQRQEIPLSDSDYDTADIINISKELYTSAVAEERKDSTLKRSQKYGHNDPINIQDILPPPPDHLLQDSAGSSASSAHSADSIDYGGRHHVGHQGSIADVDGGHYSTISNLNVDKSVQHLGEDKVKDDADTLDNGHFDFDDTHPAVVQGRSPKGERRSSKSKTDKSSASIYAVVKKQTPKASRPKMSFDLTSATPAADSATTPTASTPPAVPSKSAEILSGSENSTAKAEPTPQQERVVRVNKLRTTLGLAIEGGAGTKQPIPRIINIQDTGCASGSGLQIGDLILRINDRYLDGLSHNQAARTIADAFRDRKTSYLDFLVKSQLTSTQ